MFNLFISGVEPDNYFEMVAKEQKDQGKKELTMLMSYFHCMRKGNKFLEERYKKFPNTKLLVDSGAFTFLNQPDYEKRTVEEWEKYVDIYTKWIKKQREHIFAAVELDIGALVGKAKVEEWRKKYFQPLEDEGIQIIYVWHGAEGIPEWERLCKNHHYVALSFKDDIAANADMGKLFAIAKKYKTKIHGLAVTGGQALTTYPWYTCDSSTWLVGTQYGEVNFFEGRKLTRLKKDKWKKLFKNKLIRKGANWALMEREDPYELQRMCLVAFLDLERYVQKTMCSKWYWSEIPVAKKLLKKKRAETVTESETVMSDNNSEEVFEFSRGTLPTIEWFEDGEQLEWEKYALAVGMDIEDNDKETVVRAIKKFYDFINDYELDNYTTEEIYELCDMFSIEANTRMKAIPLLKEAFLDHAEGRRNDFGKQEEIVAKERAKERENYVEDEEYITVSIDKKECDVLLSGFLPEAGMPEVDAYDDELKKLNIDVVRDNQGRFVKGQRKIYKPKSIYSDKLPQVSCDMCQVAADCPDYRAGYVCAYNKMFKKFDTRNYNDLMDAMHSIVQLNLGRMQRMVMLERINGGIADATVDKLMEMNFKYLERMRDLTIAGHTTGRVLAKQSTVVKEDGSTETVTSVSTPPSNPVAGGILSQIIAKVSNMPQVDPIDITPVKEENKDVQSDN